MILCGVMVNIGKNNKEVNILYKDEAVKKAYFQNRYQENKDNYKKQRETYWVRYAKRQLNKDNVTDKEVKECRNAYYREYRRTHKEQTNATLNRFWEKQAQKLNINE